MTGLLGELGLIIVTALTTYTLIAAASAAHVIVARHSRRAALCWHRTRQYPDEPASDD